MNLTARTTTILALAFLLFAGGARAQGVPVIDAGSIAQAISQLKQMQQDYANQLEQLTSLQEQLKSMTGNKAISGILNGALDVAARSSADSLSSIMTGAMTGSAIPGNSAALTTRIDDLKTTFALPDIDTFLSSTTPQDRALATQAGAGLTAMATAEDTYGRANASMGRVNQLIEGIDGNTDLKASVDYNTRMLGEIAVLLNESLRLQAASANTAGSSALQDARDRAAQRVFMRAGDE